MKAHGLLIWEGVIEDIDDPLEANRVRVRIFGLHSPNITQIPTEDLPWALVTDTGALSGIGQSPHWLKQGTTVNGYFRDGRDMQQPVVLGAILGIPQEKPNSTKGFSDPDGKYPLDDRVGESDVSRLARGDISDSILEERKSISNSRINEPNTPFAAEYPHNHVIETESGHIQEFDDTPNAERISLIHKSGTGFETHPDGTRVDIIKKDNYTRVDKGNYTLVAGDNDLWVEGQCNIIVSGDCYIRGDKIQIDGNSVGIVSQGAVDIRGASITIQSPNTSIT